MDIFQIVGVGIVGTVLSLTLRKYNPEMSLFIAIACGIIIFLMILGNLTALFDSLRLLSESVNIDQNYISIILRIVGIAYICEFGMQICKDAGESVIASKIELGGKVLIMGLSVPVIFEVMGMVVSLLP